ncbi:uncharacterized protein G2W53_037001 [Senna tora]|uniref:Uncharacterized protein n=1 Tax=Senna tora TaxID=362788 RepID=A0A834W6M6_9FABA|nr:uncharacterized protein G2W53_037001 [Senna tora]
MVRTATLCLDVSRTFSSEDGSGKRNAPTSRDICSSFGVGIVERVVTVSSRPE